jgi:hypothetical protein
MPKVIIIVNEQWPVYSFGSLPDGPVGTEVDPETYQRWRHAIMDYDQVQAELARLYEKQEP